MKGMDSRAGSGLEPVTSLQRGNLRNETLALSLIAVISWEIPPDSRCTITHRARLVIAAVWPDRKTSALL